MGSRIPPQQAAAPEAAAPAEGGGSEDQLAELIGNITDGLAMLADVMNSTGNQEAGQAVSGLQDQLTSIIEGSLAKAGGAAPQASMGMASPEAGGNPNARPASPAGV